MTRALLREGEKAYGLFSIRLEKTGGLSGRERHIHSTDPVALMRAEV
jgi:hypothetical protein